MAPVRLTFSCIITLLWYTSSAWAMNTHPGTVAEQGERQAVLADLIQPHVVSGCLPSPGAGNVIANYACEGYVRQGGQLVYVFQPAANVTVTGGDGVFWMGVHASGSLIVPGYSQQFATHYRWIQQGTRPADVDGMMIMARLVIAGGNITEVGDLRPTVSTGRQIYDVTHPAYGAIPGDGGDDSAAIQAAVDAACESRPGTGGIIFMPTGQYNLDSEVQLDCAGLTLRGDGRDSTRVTVGTNRGFVQDFPFLQESRLVVEGFLLIGNFAGSLDLLTIHHAAIATIRDVWIRTTSQDCVDILEVHNFAVTSSRIEDCAVAGIRANTFGQPTVIHSVDFNANPGNAAFTHLDITATGQWSVLASNFEGTDVVAHAMVFRGTGEFTVENNFIEKYTGAVVSALDALSRNVSIRFNNISTNSSVFLDFSPASLAHNWISVVGNRFSANNPGTTMLAISANVTNYEYCNNDVEFFANLSAHVSGLSRDISCIKRHSVNRLTTTPRLSFNDLSGNYEFNGSVILGTDINAGVNRAGEVIRMFSQAPTGQVELRAQGQPRFLVGPGDIVRIGASGSSTLSHVSPEFIMNNSEAGGVLTFNASGARRAQIGPGDFIALGSDINVNFQRVGDVFNVNSSAAGGAINFRVAGNTNVTVPAGGGITLRGITAAALAGYGAPAGTQIYCTDCSAGAGCPGGGGGKMAIREGVVWNCP